MLAHLVAFSVEHKSGGYDILECHTVEHHGGDGMKRKEPATCLVNALVDEVGRECRTVVNLIPVLKRIMNLCVRHGTAVKPHIDEVGLTFHGFARLADKRNLIDKRTVKVYAVIILLAVIIRHESEILQCVGRHEPCRNALFYLIIQLVHRTDAYLVSILITPYRKRSAPKAAAGQGPVVKILEPVAEPSCTGRLRLPVDCPVQLHHSVLLCCRTDEPAVKRIVKYRLVGTPAVRIIVHMLFYLECFVGCFKVHTD